MLHGAGHALGTGSPACPPWKGVSRKGVKCTDFASCFRGSLCFAKSLDPLTRSQASAVPLTSTVLPCSLRSGELLAPRAGMSFGQPSGRAGLSGTCLLSLLQAIGQWPCLDTYCPSLQQVSAGGRPEPHHCSDPQWLFVLSSPNPRKLRS